MSGLRIAGYLVGAVVGLVALLLAGVAIFVNPNDYKARIAQEVKAATGRDLTLQGDIKLSVFPWIALNLGPVSLGNPPGFGPEPFVSVQRTLLRARLLPLLRKKLEVGRIEIEGLDLRLRTNASRKGNWEDLGGKNATPAADTSPQHSGSLQSLDGILIKDGRISYDAITLSHLNLEVGRVAERATVPVKAEFDLTTGPGGNAASLSATFNATLDSAAQRYRLDDLALAGTLEKNASRGKLPWRFTAPALEVDAGAQTLKAPAFAAQLGAAQVSGAVAGEQIIVAPDLKGTLQLEPLALREFLVQMGVALPKIQDAAALSKLALATEFEYARKGVQLEKLVVKLDQTQLSGTAAITNLDTKAMTFDLRVDQIDLDRYLAPSTASAAPVRTAAPPSVPSPLPTTAVRSLAADGSLSIGRARIKGMTLSNMQLTLRAKEGVVHLFPLKASLYGGAYTGDITYDAHDAVPQLKVEQTVSSVDMAALLKDSIKSERLSGRGNASTSLAGAGLTSDALVKNLSGRLELNLANGAVNGIDLWYQLNRAQALLKQQPMPGGADDRRTKFDTFKMSADIAGGIATTKDLSVTSQYLRVTGAGTANLSSEVINYHLVATVLKAPPAVQGGGLSGLTLADIPVQITGTASDPKVLPDLQGILKSQLKQKLQNTLQDKLKGILGK